MDNFTTTSTSCVIVGAGPAGAMLGLLLARAGVSVILLESHLDFDRDFRGDTVHPSTLEIMDQLGLAKKLHALPHGKLKIMRMQTPDGAVTMADFSRLQTKFPYIMMLPQSILLELLTDEAKRYPNFQLVMGANVQRLIVENGLVQGVSYRDNENQWHDVRALLTVAADGRFSKVRHLAELEPIKSAPPMDVLWFRLPRRATDPVDSAMAVIGRGHLVVVLERAEDWQIGYVILKGTFAALRSAGIAELQQGLAETVPWLADRVSVISDWHQVAVLNVESSRLTRWHKPGLLLIGDAAHVMSPVGGVGINYAIQDAVETANLLADKLRRGSVSEYDLSRVQKSREFPVKVIQRFQRLIQDRIAAPGLDQGKPFRIPLFLRVMSHIPGLRNLPGRILAYGVRKVRVKT